MINHSCVPNCTMTARGRHLVLEAIADVQSGEELTYCYLRSFAEGGRETRVPWGFDCDCGRCTGAITAPRLVSFDAKHRCACGKIVTATAAAAARALGRCRCHAHNALHRTAAAESEWDRAAAAVTVAGAAEASA